MNHHRLGQPEPAFQRRMGRPEEPLALAYLATATNLSGLKETLATHPGSVHLSFTSHTTQPFLVASQDLTSSLTAPSTTMAFSIGISFLPSFLFNVFVLNR